jgi:hypothetical protein
MPRMKWIPALRLACRQVEIINRGFILACTHTRAATDIYLAVAYQWYCVTSFHGRLSMCSTIVYIPPSTSSVPLTTVLPGQSFSPGCVDRLTFAAAATKDWPWFHETEPRPEIVGASKGNTRTKHYGAAEDRQFLALVPFRGTKASFSWQPHQMSDSRHNLVKMIVQAARW